MKSRKRPRASDGATPSSSSSNCWNAADHAARGRGESELTDRQRRRRRERVGDSTLRARRKRSAVLSHDTSAKRDVMKLKLHLTKARRDVEKLRRRLENWDEREEEERKAAAREEAERKRREEEEIEANGGKRRRRGRKGPETWKLRGAARPAWEVYDFDTRYVCPHQKAHDDARARASRVQNLLATRRGRFGYGGGDGGDVPEEAREFLGLLMQLSHLCQEAKQYKAARAALLECIELEGRHPVTTARETLMKMYLRLGRYESAYRLGSSFSSDSNKKEEEDDDADAKGGRDGTVRKAADAREDPCAWIRYSTALVSHALKKGDVDERVTSAIRSNPLCAYYLSFYDTFRNVMEYTDDVRYVDDDGPQTTLEEAIEYCTSACDEDGGGGGDGDDGDDGDENKIQAEAWKESGADVVLRDALVRAVRGSHETLRPADVDWNFRLRQIEEQFRSRKAAAVEEEEEEEHDDKDDDERQRPTNEDGDDDAEDHDDDDGRIEEEDEEEEEESNDDDDEIREKVDLGMFAGMFRTAMEMVQDSGEIGAVSTTATSTAATTTT